MLSARSKNRVRNGSKTPRVSVSRCRDLLPGTAGAGARRGHVCLGRSGQPLPRLFRGRPDRQRRSRQPGRGSGDRGAGEQTSAHLRALREPAAVGPGGKTGRDHARTPEKVVLYEQRHGGRRHCGCGGKTLHRASGGCRPAPQLQRTFGGGAHLGGRIDVAHASCPGAGLCPCTGALLLPLPVQTNLPGLRPGLRRGYRGRHPDHHDRRDRRVYGGDHPRCRRIHRSAARLLSKGRGDRAAVRGAVYL